MNRELAKKKAQSRDCHCINGEDRDSNFNVVIDEIFDYFEKKVNDDVIVSQNYHCYNCQSKNIKTTKYKCRDCKYEGRKG
jgi:hypothetical protein